MLVLTWVLTLLMLILLLVKKEMMFSVGGFFSQTAAMADASVCSRATPFRLGVNFDGFEAVGTGAGTNAKEMAKFNEASAATVDAADVATTPLGFQGFSLGFAQLGC